MNINWCILLPVAAALIGAVLGWLLRSLSCGCDDEKNEIEKLKAKNTKLEADLKACLSRKPERIEVPVPVSSVSSSLGAAAVTESEPKLNFDAAAAKAAIGKKVIGDDLKVVEGIGPKIEGLFHAEGIKTWYQLSKAPVSRCQEVLNTGGQRYEIHNPSTWPQQAGLAFEGKWEELNALQDRLDGGVDRG